MMRLPLATATAFLLAVAPALAQSGFSQGGMANNRSAAQRQIPGQALNTNPETAPRPGTAAGDRLTRAQRQAQQGERFRASGLATNAAPAPASPLTHVPGPAAPRR